MAKQDNTNVSATPETPITPDVTISPAPTANGAPPTPPVETPTQVRTFTQAEMDQVIKDRLERERAKYADHAELKKAADRLKEIEDAQKTELEKLQERLTQFEQQATQTTQENKRLKLSAKIASIAGSLGAVDPHDANFQMATQAIDPDGDGADDKIKDSIEALKAQRPYLFGKAQPHVEPFNPDGGPGDKRESDTQRRARIYGSGGQIWDTGKAAQQGGGVVFGPGWTKET